MFKLLLYILLGWVLYKVIFDFIIPVYRSTSHIRRQVRDIQDQMRNQQQPTPPPPPQPQPNKSKPVRDEGDYIDFEEVK